MTIIYGKNERQWFIEDNGKDIVIKIHKGTITNKGLKPLNKNILKIIKDCQSKNELPKI